MHYADQLESSRLVTRFITANDAITWLEYCGDPIATKYTALPGMSPAEMAEFVIQRTLNRYSDKRLGLQALIDKQTGAFIGKCGLLRQERVGGVTEIEIRYHLLRKYWGQGYATEAAQMFRDYGFNNHFSDSIVSIIHPENEPSKNVAIRNGMKLVNKDTLFMGEKFHLFRITRAEWEGL